MKLIARLARELNWSRRAWSAASDREFHESLYRTDHYDPFSWAYPGYTTIRRFADLIEPFLPERGIVLDVGCGPGEITCELASRRRDLHFTGIDHSSAAITKAQANMARRNVANVRFECRDVEQDIPQEPIDLVTLFDSFHHLITPAEFVKRLDSRVKRWALIEPRGSWAGTWQKDLDFDWLAQDLDKIRARIAAVCAPAFALRATAGKPAAPDASRVITGSIPEDISWSLRGSGLVYRGLSLQVKWSKSRSPFALLRTQATIRWPSISSVKE